MSKFISTLAIVAIFFSFITPALAKGKKPKQPANSSPAKIIIPRVNSSKSRSVSPDILKAIETGKKYSATPIKEKSQLETQSQYEARVAASQPTDIQPVDLSISVDKTLRYNAEEQFATISIEEIYDEGRNYGFETLKQSDFVSFQSQHGKITCSNSFGAKFYYSHTEYSYDRYAIAYRKQNLPEADEYTEYGRRFAFKVPMSNNEIRNYITTDEKEFNGRLKFIVKIIPTSPFYKKESHYSGDPCPNASKYATSLSTSSGGMYYALFEIQSLKLVDSLTGKIFLERSYPLVKK
jgi:hypothetical protein